MSKSSLVTTVTIAIILGLLSLWLGSIQTTISDVTGLKPQITDMQRRLLGAEKWQDDWESGGELKADVEQNKDIEALRRDLDRLSTAIDKLDAMVDELRDNIHVIEMKNAARK